MKKTKIAALFLVLCLISGLTATPAYAGNIGEEPVPDEPVEPYSYTENYMIDFQIAAGTADVTVDYIGIPGLTTRAEISIVIQHRFLFWWSDVSGGTWNDTVYGSSGSIEHSLALSQYGDFRAVINVKVYGSGSDYDEIDQTLYDSN